MSGEARRLGLALRRLSAPVALPTKHMGTTSKRDEGMGCIGDARLAGRQATMLVRRQRAQAAEEAGPGRVAVVQESESCHEEAEGVSGQTTVTDPFLRA